MLSVVLPKGSLETQVLELFDAADLTVIRGGERDYNARIDDPIFAAALKGCWESLGGFARNG